MGINSILGFTECFNAIYFCRFCKLSKDETKVCCIENQEKLRNVVGYEVDIKNNNITYTGLKEDSIWNTLQNFHVVENYVVDCFHDILEGVCHYDLLVILKYYVQNKIFSIEELNQRILIFDFGLHSTNKPPLFNQNFHTFELSTTFNW